MATVQRFTQNSSCELLFEKKKLTSSQMIAAFWLRRNRNNTTWFFFWCTNVLPLWNIISMSIYIEKPKKVNFNVINILFGEIL